MRIIIFVMLSILFSSCGNFDYQSQKNVGFGDIVKEEFDGHTYIMWRDYHRGNMIHDPDCKCGAGEK